MIQINFTVMLSMSSLITNRQFVSYINYCIFSRLLAFYSLKKKKEILTNPLFSTPRTGKPFHSLSPISREKSQSLSPLHPVSLPHITNSNQKALKAPNVRDNVEGRTPSSSTRRRSLQQRS